jgi:hypothetical protein
MKHNSALHFVHKALLRHLTAEKRQAASNASSRLYLLLPIFFMRVMGLNPVVGLD